MKGVIKMKNIKFIKKCLISPITEIILNIIYILSFLVMFILFFSEGEYYNNYHINEISKNHLNYELFLKIKNSTDFENYLELLLKKIYTIDYSKDSLPILIPLSPIRFSQFSNDPNDCSEHLNDLKSCNKNFSCVISSLTELYSFKCGENFFSNNDLNSKKNPKISFSKLVPKLNGFYSRYDILSDGNMIDLTFNNYKNDNYIKVHNLINEKDLKLLLLQINFKLNSNENYINAIIGIEMINYYRNIKKIFQISIFNNILPDNTVLFVFGIFFDIVIALEIIKLIYEINVKVIWSVHTFVFIHLVISVAFIVFNVIELYISHNLNLSINLKEFSTFLPYISIKRYTRMFYSILFIFFPFKIFSLLSWWKTISEPFIKILHVFFRMFPGILVTIILFLIFSVSFIFINYFLFVDTFPQFQTLYDSFLFLFQSNKIQFLFNQKNYMKLIHNLSQSRHVIFFIFFEILFIYISFIILISTFAFLFKKANNIDMPKVENEEYISKLKQIEKKLEKGESLEYTDIQKLPRQILWINLSSKNYLFKMFLSKYDLLLFKNSNQVISFIKYLFAVKPELQFQKLYKIFNIIIEFDENCLSENNFDIIYYLTDWLIFVGCDIPICIYSDIILSSPIRMRLLKAYKYIFFVNSEIKLEKFISENSGDKYSINSNNFSFISEKKLIIKENDSDDESDTGLIKRRKTNQPFNSLSNKTRKGRHFGAQKTLMPYSSLNLRNNNA